MFLIMALVAGILGFSGIAGTAVGIAKILFLVFLGCVAGGFLVGSTLDLKNPRFASSCAASDVLVIGCRRGPLPSGLRARRRELSPRTDSGFSRSLCHLAAS
jgi:uncharacterized membrane protein YtjA (UPF0391 family)